ncbi:Dissimilatory sulfite reductase (desulfoviridin), alpha and beta subunit [Lachnospiraceae bacterium TWA4]|nr:Dissimilatory sulfite reductase (desulfoviridin), alpha and beta subunit [Lachnospiraceae bacterium TWA4]
MAADLLEAYIKKLKEEPSLAPEDIKRVKGMGYLNHKGTNKFNARVVTRNGRVSTEEVQKILDAANKYGDGTMMFTTRLTVEVSGIDYENIEAFDKAIVDAGLSVGGTGPKIRPVVSCKGSTCQYGLYDTYALSREIHERFYIGYRGVKLNHKFKIAVGGCPNNCVKPSLNDVGLIGARIPDYNVEACKGCKTCKMEEACPVGAISRVDKKIQIDEEKCLKCGRCVNKCRFDCAKTYTDGWRIVLGGRWGKNINIGSQIHKIFTDKAEVLDTIEKIILYYRLEGKKGERFAQTIARVGFDQVEERILTNEMLERKEEILAIEK